MQLDEIERIRRARLGDAEAFRELVNLYAKPLWRAAWRVLGDADEAEDAVQDAFLRAWQSLRRFDDGADFSAWIYRIAVNAAIDKRRARRRRGPTFGSPESELAAELTEPGPYRSAVSAEVARRMHTAIAELPERERTAILLRHFEGRSIEEIARVLGRRENAAKHTVFRAVRKLRIALKPLREA